METSTSRDRDGKMAAPTIVSVWTATLASSSVRTDVPVTQICQLPAVWTMTPWTHAVRNQTAHRLHLRLRGQDKLLLIQVREVLCRTAANILEFKLRIPMIWPYRNCVRS